MKSVVPFTILRAAIHWRHYGTHPVLGGCEEIKQPTEGAHAVQLTDRHQLLDLVDLLVLVNLHDVLVEQSLQLVRHHLHRYMNSRFSSSDITYTGT